MKIIRKLFFQSISRYLIALIITIVISLIYLFTHGFNTFINYVNAISIGSMVTILIGGLSLVTSLGAFDIYGYAGSKISRNKKQYIDLVDYSTKKAEKRKGRFPYIPYFTVGLVFLILSIILEMML